MNITTQELDSSVTGKLVPTGQDTHFTDATKHIPSGGALGQVVTKGVTNPEWSTPAAAGDPNGGRLQADFGFDGAVLSATALDSNGTLSLGTVSLPSAQKTVTANGNACIKTTHNTVGKTVTAVGSAQIDTAQFKVGTSSGLFNGSSDNLSTADSDDWAFGTGDLTIQFWVRFNALPGAGSTQAFYGSADVDPNNMLLGLNNNAGTHRFRLNSKISGVDTDVYWNLSPNLSTNTWYHIALCRSGNNIRLFLDGVKQGSDQAFSVTMTNVPSALTIGSFNANYRLNGWLDEFEIAKGICRYSANFTPSTTALVADSYTKLLLHFEGSDASTTFTDSSGGTVSSKVGTGRGYFDGTGDYLSVPDSSDWAFGTGDFTLSSYILFAALPAPGAEVCLFSQYGDASNYWRYSITNSAGTYQVMFVVRSGGTVLVNNVQNITIIPGTWYHFEACRYGNVLKYFLDGVQQGSDVAFNITMPDVVGAVNIASYTAGMEYYFNGYMDELIISKGIARHTANFTPSVTALTPDQYTMLLLHMDGVADSTTFLDDKTIAATSGTALKLYTPADLDAWGNLKYTQVTPTNAAVATNVYGKNDSGTAQVAVSTVYTTKNFSINSQDAAPSGGMFFSPDGTKMYLMGAVNDTVYQYTLSTAWDVSTMSYASKSFSVISQDANGRGVYITSDGLKMYIYGASNKTVYQYTIGTAWDVSTASYASKSFLVSAQDTTPYGLTFNSDGTKMYINGVTNKAIFQYTLSTAWDVSTASYASKSLSVTSQDSSPRKMVFNPSGTKLFVFGGTNQTVYQYALSTAWDVSTGTYSNKSYLTTAQDTDAYGIALSTDGSSFYLMGGTNKRVYQYSLMSAFDIQALNLLKLKAGSSATDNYYNTYLVRITGGTGIGQSRIIADYTGSTLTAVTDVDWTTQLDATSTYVLYALLKTGVTSIADLSDVSATTYAELAVLWALSRVSSSDTTPTVATPSVTWEGSGLGWRVALKGTTLADAASLTLPVPQNGSRVRITISSKSSVATNMYFKFNGDGGTNYRSTLPYIQYNGAWTVAGSSAATLVLINGNPQLSTTKGFQVIEFSNDTTEYKSGSLFSTNGAVQTHIGSFVWENNTVKANSVTFTSGDTFKAGATYLVEVM